MISSLSENTSDLVVKMIKSDYLMKSMLQDWCVATGTSQAVESSALQVRRAGPRRFGNFRLCPVRLETVAK